jgi:YVTN family beta-propeller protein
MRAPGVAVGAATALAVVCFGVWTSARVGVQPDGSILIPTGQRLTPAGVQVEVNDRPLGMVPSRDGKWLAITTGSNFKRHALHLLDTSRNAIVQTVPLGHSFVGVAFSNSGDTIYVGGGQDNDVKVLRRGSGGFSQEASIAIPGGAPSGLALSADGGTLYVALNLKHAVAVIDLGSRRVEQIPVGVYPYTVTLSPDGRKLYVSNWGGRRAAPGDITDGAFPVVLDPRTGIPSTGTVSVIDTKTRAVTRHIDVGLHPSGMAMSARGHRLYVANANSDTVSAIDTRTDRVAATIHVRLWRQAPLGSAPNALDVSRDGKTLYVANAANNAVAVVDLVRSGGTVRGFIPTGWYPTAVALEASGKRLYVANGYGFGSIAPLKGGARGRAYRDRVGVVSVVDLAGGEQRATWTGQVLNNNRAQQPPTIRPADARHPVPPGPGEASPIRHVFYVIKENRTYDQVFGDLPQGNGDASLVQFGRDVTPNHHALAEKYVLLDNFYAPGDQSALGHRWCTQGYASDWLHKYGNGRNDANPMLFAPTDFLWDHARANGLPVRSFGERGQNTIEPPSATWTDIYNDWKSGAGKVRITAKSVVLGLRDIYATDYPAFGTKITDQWRMDVFLRHFREYEKNGQLPRLIVLLLPEDHTNGTAPGYPTPRAMVADNDLALGRLVEAVSQSRYWKESAILVTEDDAQNGLDHVDGHRTVGLVIGPWARRGAVDSTFYTIINMYRTIEQILGLAPTNQFDLAAEPMFTAFTAEPDFSTYTALPNQIPLDEMNPRLGGLKGPERELARSSLAMDFDEPDAAPEDTLNRAIWHSVKGFGVKYPARTPAGLR